MPAPSTRKFGCESQATLQAISPLFNCGHCLGTDRTTHGLSTHNEHPLGNDQQDKTMTQQAGEMTRDEKTIQRQDVNEIGADQGHNKGGDKMIYVQHRGGLQAMTEQNVRRSTIKNSDVYVVHGGKIMIPGAIGHLRNNAIVHVVDKMPGGGKKKGPESQVKSE